MGAHDHFTQDFTRGGPPKPPTILTTLYLSLLRRSLDLTNHPPPAPLNARRVRLKAAAAIHVPLVFSLPDQQVIGSIDKTTERGNTTLMTATRPLSCLQIASITEQRYPCQHLSSGLNCLPPSLLIQEARFPRPLPVELCLLVENPRIKAPGIAFDHDSCWT